jgi:hypothetical protein
MKNFFYKWLPLVVVVVCAFNAIASYGVDNMPAVHANLTALCGWLIVAFDAFTNPLSKGTEE